MLLTRILTALVLIPLVVWALLKLPPGGLAVLLGVVVALSAWEWAQFATRSQPLRAAYAVLLGVAVLALPLAGAPLAVAGVLLWLAMFGWLLAYPRGLRPGITQAPMRLALGAAILWLFAAAALALAAVDNGRVLVLLTLVLVWAMDVGGYFFGKRFGRRKLAPQVSPNKSWEGFAGGALLGAIVSLAGMPLLGLSGAGALQFALLGTLVAMASVVGDLTESMFKRQSGIKDSGALLPGHGGLLDRLDSTYAALPLMLAGWLLLPTP